MEVEVPIGKKRKTWLVKDLSILQSGCLVSTMATPITTLAIYMIALVVPILGSHVA